MKIVYMGTPEFAVDVLDSLIKAGHEIGYCVTQPDKEKNRGKKLTPPPVKVRAEEAGIKVLQPLKVKGNEELFETLKQYGPDIIVVAAYGKILPKDILELPKYGCINTHASLLPKLRGSSPIQQAIVTGEEETGVTIMQMAEGMDTGDILISESIRIGSMNYSELSAELAKIGGRLAVKALELIESGKAVFTKQDDSKATYAGMISKQDGHIDFTKSPAEIERLIRGFDPWPGAYCEYNGETVKFWKAEALPVSSGTAEAGTVIAAGNEGISIACGGETLLVTELQMPGKKRVAAKDYLRGNSFNTGTVLK